MGKALRHAHKYYFGLIVGGSQVWACAFPFCNHYMPHHMKGMVENKMSVCWNCGEEFILESQLMNRAKPICIDCLGLGGLVEEIRANEDPILRASRERLEKISSNQQAQSEPIVGSSKGRCRTCGAETKDPKFTLCIPCALK